METLRKAPQDILLRTKLYIPPVSANAVSRPRLLRRLDQSLEHPLTLLSAPAGFGKTTLLSDWIAQAAATLNPAPAVAWVSLDERDNDPARFGRYVLAALATLEIGINPGEPGDGHPTHESLEATLAAIINQIAEAPEEAVSSSRSAPEAKWKGRRAGSHGPTGVVLILDDYHAITAEAIHVALSFLLDHLPPQMHLVLVCRAEPPLALAHLRARGQLVELRAADLRFTPGEAGVFLQQVMRLGLSTDDVAVLEARTEGWIAGLQLAALALTSASGSDASPKSLIQAFNGSHRYIVDYLAEQVLLRQPTEVQTFLLQTSILDRFTGGLCDAVTEQTNGQAMLERLERANLFLVPLDDNRRWYRYHHLFADFLRERLRQTQPAQWSELHHRAAEGCERQGLIAEAVSHALAVGETEQAARLVEQIAEAIWMGGEMTRLLDWLEALPDDLVQSRPRLCIFHAWILNIVGQFIATEARLGDAQEGLARVPDAHERRVLRGMWLTTRAIVALMKGEAAQALELSTQALADLPASNWVWRSVVSRNQGNAYLLLGQTAAASQAFSEAASLSQMAGNLYMQVVALYELAELLVVQGQLHRAAETFRAGLQLVERAGVAHLTTTGALHIGLSDVLREWNDLEDGLQHALLGCELGREGRSLGIQVCGDIRLGMLAQARGDAAGAAQAFQRAVQLAPLHRRTSFLAHHEAQARLWARQGDWAAAEHWIQACGLRVDDDVSYMNEAAYLTLARVCLSQNRASEALPLLERLGIAAEAASRMGRVIEILMSRALALQASGEMDAAVDALKRALELAEPEGYVRLFVDEGEPMLALLQSLNASLENGKMKNYAGNLLAVFGIRDVEPTQLHPSREAFSPHPLTEPLSERELEVLRLLAEGLSNRDIARRIVVSPGTVKRHIHNIYGKLDTHNRLQTVERARQWRLL